jgi:hypothetical protein
VLRSYNREVRIASLLLVLLSLAACNRGNQSKDAVRQGVLDYLASKGLNMAGMTVDVTSVQFAGERAEANVSITAKGGTAGTGMTPVYILEQKNGKWAVTGRKETGEAPHGAAPAAAGPENPHGGTTPPGAMPGAGGKMPSPEDLPPTGKKK